MWKILKDYIKHEPLEFILFLPIILIFLWIGICYKVMAYVLYPEKK